MPKRRTLLSPDARRQSLLEAAVRVFARKGYTAASITDIIEAAGVARGTFYLYFESKQQIFLGIVDAFHIDLRATLETQPAPSGDVDGAALLAASFRRWLAFFAERREATRVVLKEADVIDPTFSKRLDQLRRSLVGHFSRRFRTLQDLGLVRRSLDADVVAHIQVGVFETLVKSFVLAAGEPDIAGMAAALADFEWNGIRPER